MRTRSRLPGGYSLLSIRRPLTLLAAEYAALRTTLALVSDAAFGRTTASRWDTTFTPDFLDTLDRFFVLCDAEENVVGWSSYRARTIGRDRVVCFPSTGVLPRCQRSGLVAAVQHRAARSEARHHPFRRIVTAERTHNTPAEPVPVSDQPLIIGIGAWLDLDIDPMTALIRGANDEDGAWLAYGRRRALGLMFSRSPRIDVGSLLGDASGPG